jgi:hypothetical protein
MKNKFVDGFNHALGLHGFDYDKISEEVYIGTNMCCQFGFDRELLSKGVRADISLEEIKVDVPLGVDYFVWLPTLNHQAPTQEKLTFGVQSLEFFAKRTIKVYVHCKNGHGRAPALFAAYLIKTGTTVEAALAMLKEKRPEVHINEVQMAALETFSTSFKG